MDDVSLLVTDVAPAFSEQAARLPESGSVATVVQRAFVGFVSHLGDPAAAEEEIGPLLGRIGRQVATGEVGVDTMQRVLEEASSSSSCSATT